MACRHLAFRHPKVDRQVWIEEGERALPRRVVINYKDEPGQPQFAASLWDRSLDPGLPHALFDFVPPPGVERVTMAAVPTRAAPARAGRGRRRDGHAAAWRVERVVPASIYQGWLCSVYFRKRGASYTVIPEPS